MCILYLHAGEATLCDLGDMAKCGCLCFFHIAELQVIVLVCNKIHVLLCHYGLNVYSHPKCFSDGSLNDGLFLFGLCAVSLHDHSS